MKKALEERSSPRMWIFYSWLLSFDGRKKERKTNTRKSFFFLSMKMWKAEFFPSPRLMEKVFFVRFSLFVFYFSASHPLVCMNMLRVFAFQPNKIRPRKSILSSFVLNYEFIIVEPRNGRKKRFRTREMKNIEKKKTKMFFLPFFFINKNSRENSFKKRAVRGKKTEWKIGCGTHMRGRCWRKFFIGGFSLWRWNSGNDGTSIRCVDWWISDCTSVMQIFKRFYRNFRPKVFIQAEKKSFQSARYETGKWKMLRLSIDGWGRRKVRLSWRRLRVQLTGSWVDQPEKPCVAGCVQSRRRCAM